MRIRPIHVARSLIDTVESTPDIDVGEACVEAFRLLRARCPGMPPRQFVALVEREAKRRGSVMSGMLFVPTDPSMKAEIVEKALTQKSGTTVHVDRAVEPELIGGAVLFLEHRRLDSSVQGALRALLNSFLEPLE